MINYNTINNKFKDDYFFQPIDIQPFEKRFVKVAIDYAKDIDVKSILEYGWDDFVEYADSVNYVIRDSVISNVNKTLICRTEELGFALIKCQCCDHIDVVYATCKSRICSSCGNKTAKQRAVSIASVAIEKTHRHCVFTIAEELRPYFFDNYDRINLLFKAVSETIHACARKRNKGKEFTPGFVCTLHTYGRDLKFNPHIHVLLAEAYLDNTGTFIENKYFDFKFMRRCFRTILLKYLQEDINTRQMKNLSYYLTNKNDNGFYVRMPKNPYVEFNDSNKNNIKNAISYIVRYVAKPCIANSRIIDFDKETNLVTFIFQPHDDEDGEWKQATMHIRDFIYKLIAHIPDDQFKMIRYYGFYAFNNKLRKKFKNNFKHLYKREFIKYLKNIVYKCQYMLMHYFDQWGIRTCPKCFSPMEFVYMKYHPDRKCCSYVYHHPSFINTLDLQTNS